MLVEISRSIELDAGHRVPFHNAGCRFLHGHRYKVTAFVTADAIEPEETGKSDAGMVVDFGLVKAVLMEEIHAVFDHRLILWARDPLVGMGTDFMDDLSRIGIAAGVVEVPCIPTAEELAKYWGSLVIAGLQEKTLERRGIRLTQLQVQETPNSIATWHSWRSITRPATP